MPKGGMKHDCRRREVLMERGECVSCVLHTYEALRSIQDTARVAALHQGRGRLSGVKGEADRQDVL